MRLSLFVRWLMTTLAALLFSQVLLAQGATSNAAISGEYIVKFKPQINSVRGAGKSGVAGMAAANKLASEKGARILSAFKNVNVHAKFESAGMLHISDVSASNYQALKNNPEVEFIEPNYMLSLPPDFKQDSQPVTQMGVAASSTDTYSQSFAQVQVTESWALEKSPASATKTIVAVIDTGLDVNHAVFKDSNAVYKNMAEVNGLPGVDDDGNGYVDDKNGWNFVDRSPYMYDDADHGTHVAGIIVGAGQDIFQIPVRESKVRIMPLKFLNGNGSGTTADAINAMYYAVNNGAKVINNSWGGPSYSRSLHDAYKYAYDNDVVIVTAAGNAHVDIGNSSTAMYPAALDTPSNITVGNSTSTDQRHWTSNYSSSLVHVFAPGASIMSTIPGSHCGDANNLFYYCLTNMTGTSMAAPFVAGLAALAIREAPHLSAYQIRGVIMSAIDVSSALNGYSQTAGRVNALKVMQIAQAQVSAQAWAPEYSPVYKSDFSSNASGDGGAGAGAGGCGLVKALGDEMQGPPSGGGMGRALFFGLMFWLPLAMAYRLRQKQIKPQSLRQYERYSVAKDVMIQIGDQVVNAASQTLAVGGLSFKSEQQFEKGQKIKIKIADVHEEVEGEIVWSSELNSFGVKFLNITENLKSQVQGLTQGLVPT